MNLKTISSHIITGATVVGIVSGALWGIGRPLAQDFVKERVKEHVDTRLEKLETGLDAIKQQQIEQALTQVGQGKDLDNIKLLAREQRDDIKTILRALGQ